MRKNKIIDFIFILLAVLVIIGVNTFAHVCGSMMGMEAPCHTTRTYVIVISIVLALASAINLFVKINLFDIIVKAIQILGSILLILTPTVIAPVCKMETMHCNSHTKPFLILIGVAGAIIVVGSIIVDVIKNKGEGDE